MVKPDDRNAKRVAGGDGLPRDLIGIAGLDDIRPFPLQHALDRLQPQQDAVAGSARDERRLIE